MSFRTRSAWLRISSDAESTVYDKWIPAFAEMTYIKLFIVKSWFGLYVVTSIFLLWFFAYSDSRLFVGRSLGT